LLCSQGRDFSLFDLGWTFCFAGASALALYAVAAERGFAAVRGSAETLVSKICGSSVKTGSA